MCMSMQSRRESGFCFRCEKKSREDLHFEKLPCFLWLKNVLLVSRGAEAGGGEAGEVVRDGGKWRGGCTRNETKLSSLKCSGIGM